MLPKYLAPSLVTAVLLAAAVSHVVLAEDAKTAKNEHLAMVLAAQPSEIKERYAARNPIETLTFFEVKKGDTIIETLPGGGWYSRILYPYLGETGKLIGANYPRSTFERFGWDEKRVQSLLDRHKNWPKTIAGSSVAKGGDIEIYTMTEMPDHFNGIADKVLFIRSLHNINRFDKETGHLNIVLAEAFRSLKPGGIAGVVQHRAPKTASDGWANGSKGYLKQSYVITAFETAGFKFAGAREFNANPKDRPSGKDIVWRLPPTLRGSEKNTAKWNEYNAIGESDRMTLKFIKPLE